MMTHWKGQADVNCLNQSIHTQVLVWEMGTDQPKLVSPMTPWQGVLTMLRTKFQSQLCQTIHHTNDDTLEGSSWCELFLSTCEAFEGSSWFELVLDVWYLRYLDLLFSLYTARTLFRRREWEIVINFVFFLMSNSANYFGMSTFQNLVCLQSASSSISIFVNLSSHSFQVGGKITF